ncbi:MAG TPA: septal ring lytic transglycosylase RlpA family protein [Candidatus Acidoferrales bacterium]
MEPEIKARRTGRRNSSRAESARKNSFVADYASDAERTRAGLGFRSAAGVWIFVAMMVAFGVVSCSQHKTTAHVPSGPSATTPATAQTSGAESADALTSAGTVDAATGAHLGPVPSGESNDVRSRGPVEKGIASWYGVPYHGRRASDGEIYDMYKFTAAHRTLPFNTVVRVTNLANDKQVDLRIIDRGPFVDDRIIDLSLAGARAIDMVGPGTARVKVEIVSAPGNESVTAGRFAVQVGAFAERANAERLREKLAADYEHISIQGTTGPTGRLFRVRVGSEPNENAAQKLGNKLSGVTGMHTFVVRLDDAPASTTPGSDSQR